MGYYMDDGRYVSKNADGTYTVRDGEKTFQVDSEGRRHDDRKDTGDLPMAKNVKPTGTPAEPVGSPASSFQCARGNCGAEIGHPANQDAHNHDYHLEHKWGMSSVWRPAGGPSYGNEEDTEAANYEPGSMMANAKGTRKWGLRTRW